MQNPNFINVGVTREDHARLIARKKATGQSLHFLITLALDSYMGVKKEKAKKKQ